MKSTQSLRLLRLFFNETLSLLLCDLLVNLSNVILAWDCKITRLHYCSVDVLAPVFTHFLFVDDTQELSNELWIDCEQLNKSIPDAEDLVSNNLDISCNKSGNFIWLTNTRLKSSLEWSQSAHTCHILDIRCICIRRSSSRADFVAQLFSVLQLRDRRDPLQFLNRLVQLHQVFSVAVV